MSRWWHTARRALISRSLFSRHVTSHVLAVCILAACIYGHAHAAADDITAADLYRSRTPVTGQGEANRLAGFAICLQDVLIKTSGDLNLARDPRLDPYRARARDLVAVYNYHDQMSGTPTRDEQGTRDRPYDLTVDFDPEKIDGVLRSLGVAPWHAHRPVLGMFVEMALPGRSFIVTSDDKRSDLQRDALRAAAAKRGMSIGLPDTAGLTKAGIAPAALMTTPSPMLSPVVATDRAEIILVGQLTWDDSEFCWVAEWRLDGQRAPHRWRFRSVTFDEAFGRGIGDAAQILSGNGEPQD